MNPIKLFTETSHSFEGQRDGEEVIMSLHPHWYTLLSKVLVLFMLGLAPIFFLIIFGQFILAHNLIPLFSFLACAYYMVIWWWFFYNLTLYSLDTWIISNVRIIDSTQVGLFHREVSELNISKIEDVSIDVDGATQTTFNYGTVEVQTAAKDSKFIFRNVPDPQAVKDTIAKVMSDYHHGSEDLNEFVPKTDGISPATKIDNEVESE